MSNQNADEGAKSGVKVDLTINIPTMLSLFAMVAGSITYVNGQITAINNQQLVTVGDVKVLQTQVAAQGAAQTALRADTATQLAQFRTEVRSDLRDLKEGVDQLNRNSGR
ncbi:putative lysis protein B [Cronobacter phage JC01]|uniref:Putative lysis protein B n=1 Tax=Cronobacter phage JC01 TaxID=2729575 RepID=A0A6M3YKG3_9CAUD|nr:Rz-like spanin [Cronobacter phage JC01]QJI52254.1 putative lysis protein B [Cronobacter phage JC01]